MTDALVEREFNTVVANAMTLYRAVAATLAPADPRLLHLRTILALIVQHRCAIDFEGKQNLPRFVSDQYIDDLAGLWDNARLPAVGSRCTQRFIYPSSALRTIPVGARVTDGKNTWRVVEDPRGVPGDVIGFSFLDDGEYILNAIVECLQAGAATNGTPVGQIDTVVDAASVPDVTGTRNTTETADGSDSEALAVYRARFREDPASEVETTGTRAHYRSQALKASPLVADAMALYPEDDIEGDAIGPSRIRVVIIKGVRDENDVPTVIGPEPDSDLITLAQTALQNKEKRPLGDYVTVTAPEWSIASVGVTYWLSSETTNEEADEINAAVALAFETFVLWQQSKIGRDPNPSELITRLLNAGAKRVTVTGLSAVAIKRDQSVLIASASLTFAGFEDE